MTDRFVQDCDALEAQFAPVQEYRIAVTMAPREAVTVAAYLLLLHGIVVSRVVRHIRARVR